MLNETSNKSMDETTFIDRFLTRRDRREQTKRKRWAERIRPGGRVDRWEWNFTQKHPRDVRASRRSKNRIARASRKANR